MWHRMTPEEKETKLGVDAFWKCTSVLVLCMEALSPSVCVFVLLPGLSVPRLAYLLQRGVRDAIAGKAEVRHGRVELLEEQSKSPISGSTIREDVGDLLTDALQEDRLGDVAPQKLTHSCQICQADERKDE